MSRSVTVGIFDGVHLGHQALLKAMAATGKETVVITISTHPRNDLLIYSLEHRLKEIKALGVDLIECFPFEFLKSEEADHFLQDLIEKGLSSFFLGYDHHLGKGRKGTPAFIQEYLSSRHVEVHPIPPVEDEGEPISSRRIRHLIAEGNLNEASSLLGRPYSIFGTPIQGAGIGRQMETPTLNFSVEGLVTPPFGVYVALLKAEEKEWRGVANLGVSPTLKQGSPPLFEIHLLDHHLLPPPPYEVIPLQFLREEKHFSSKEELKGAISLDKKRALDFFKKS